MLINPETYDVINGTDDLIEEQYQRLEFAAGCIDYNMTFLDDLTGGILPSDVVLLGAKTGGGKTQIASNITYSMAKKGRSVFYFALEARRHEIIQRIKYKELKKLFAETPNFREWLKAKNESSYINNNTEINKRLSPVLQNITTMYRKAGKFNIYDLENIIEQNYKYQDLFIIDHLHYFDHTTDNEIKALQETIKKIRDLALLYHKPIIVLAQLRKPQGGKYATPMLPGLEEFRGSNDISNIATQIITIGRYTGEAYASNDIYTFPTLFKVCKLRIDNSVSFYTSLCRFNAKHGEYEKGYLLGKMIKGDTEFEELFYTDLPDWAENSLNTKIPENPSFGGAYDR